MHKFGVLIIALALVFASVGAGQYARRSRGAGMSTATTGPYNGPAVTFHGTLKSVSKKEILLELDAAGQNEDQSLTLRRSGKTKFFRNDQEVKASDIPIGTKVTLDATRDGDMKLSALRVAVSPPAKQAGEHNSH